MTLPNDPAKNIFTVIDDQNPKFKIYNYRKLDVIPDDVLLTMLQEPDYNKVNLIAVALHNLTPPDKMLSIIQRIEDENVTPNVLSTIAKNRNATSEVMLAIVEQINSDKVSDSVLRSIAGNPNVTSEVILAITQKIGNEKVTSSVLGAIARHPNITPAVVSVILEKIKNEEITTSVLRDIFDNSKTTTRMQLMILSGIRQKDKVTDFLFKSIVKKLGAPEQFRAIELPEELYNKEVLEKIKEKITSLELGNTAIQVVADKIASMLGLRGDLVKIEEKKRQFNQNKDKIQDKIQVKQTVKDELGTKLRWLNTSIRPVTEQVDSEALSKIEKSPEIMKYK